jgi:hypothetical protein
MAYIVTYELLYEGHNGEYDSHLDGPDILQKAANSLDEFNDFCTETFGDHPIEIHSIERATPQLLIQLS